MFDASQHFQAFRTANSPASHAIRGLTAALAALTAFANVTSNRVAIFALMRLKLSPRFKFATPSRNAFALAVFVGFFRYLQRSASIQADSERDNLKSTVLASVEPAAVAAAVGTLCMAPESRPAIVSLLSTTAASKLFDNFLDNNPNLSYLRPLELLTFMAAGGWIFTSGFFYPESYEPSHMRQILKNVVLKRHVANELQEKYRQGFNPNPCHVRHKELHCGQFARGGFFLRVVEMALKLYAPVHLTTWILALRHPKMRSKPASDQLKGFATKMARSSTYSIGYVYLGWTLCCILGRLGDHSLSLRKLQFFLSGAIPSVAIFAESPGRRRSIGLILVSYALISAGNVATRKISWLQPGKSFVRSVLEAGCVAAAVSVTIPEFLKSNHLVQRMLLGDVAAKRLQKALKSSQSEKQQEP
ncbi:hypothetical protein DVH05_023531 [Phytophthora capsici]|nr:hypothetical protein DVH05_023531 [Phytophthora capsici]|eukprot:jgi/Phyca11/97028/e_gw1.1.1138.1